MRTDGLETNRRQTVAVLALVTGLAGPVATPALGQTPREVCEEACHARNVEASCAWLSMQPRRCLRHALAACRALVRGGGAVSCPLPPDLPACLTNQSCPFGTLCADSTCQVIGCDESEGFATCTGNNRCVEGRCVVEDCQGSSQNCPAGQHCQPVDAFSGTCEPNDPTRLACTVDTDCIAPGSFNPRCLRGVCAARSRRRRCEADEDCFNACKTSRAAVRIPRCNAAGQCVCANCDDDAQCDTNFNCSDGQAPGCRPNGACFCPPPEAPPGDAGVCTSFDMPPCTPCWTDADCGGFDLCLQSASCDAGPLQE